MNAVVRPTVPPPGRAFHLFVLALLLSPSLGAAQAPPPIATHIGAANQDRLGTTTAVVGDVDRDGCADYLIGVPGAPDGQFAGSALLYSGRTSLLLHRIDGEIVGEQRAWVAALGDVDRDSIPDYAVAAPNLPNEGYLVAGSIWVISGRTHEMLYDLRGPTERAKFGLVMTGIGDADGDGGDDFAVGASLLDAGPFLDVGAVYVVRGYDGALIRRFEGQFAGQRFGFSVAGVGDLDGDALADIAIGAPALGVAAAASVRIVSPKSGQTIGGIISNQIWDAMGFLVAGLGDVNGDGKPDWLASAPWRDENGGADNGAAWVFSGSDGAALLQVEGINDGDHWGLSLAAAGLLNNDVIPDFAVGFPDARFGGGSASGCAVIYSGSDGARILQIGPDPAIHTEASWMTGGGDVDGDGNDDLMVSAALYSPGTGSWDRPARGRVDVFSYAASRVTVRTDLLPGLCPNVLPSDPNALVTLLVLGGPALDVSRIVPESIRMNGLPPAAAAPAPADQGGPGEGTQAEPCLCDGSGPDGYPDRAFQFRRTELEPFLGAKGPHGYTLRMTGRLDNGMRLEGAACALDGSRMPFVAPNPVRRGSSAALFVEVPRGGAAVQVTVHDIRGRLVRKLWHERMPEGSRRLAWDGRLRDGAPAPGGIYFVRTKIGPVETTSRVVLVP